MSDTLNGTPPPAPIVTPDIAFALHALEIVNSTLGLLAAQLAKYAPRSPKCAQVGALLAGLANAAGQNHAEIMREITTGVVLAGPGDMPRRLQ